MKILLIITSLRSNYNELLSNQNKQDFQYKIRKFVIILKQRMFLFILLVLVLSIIFWYFFIIFCNIYQNNQLSLIESSLISLIISIIFVYALSFFFGLIRCYGLKYKNKVFYKIGNFVYNFF